MTGLNMKNKNVTIHNTLTPLDACLMLASMMDAYLYVQGTPIPIDDALKIRAVDAAFSWSTNLR